MASNIQSAIKRYYLNTIFVLIKNSNLLAHTPILPPLGQPFIVLPLVDSTNNYAMAKIQAGEAGHGSTYWAMEQVAGKGQRGKTWLTEPGSNIIMSVALKTDHLEMGHQWALSMAVALACYDFYKNYGSADDTRIKWPNDLYWQDRKAGGILIENQISMENGLPSWKWAIVGIGININQTSFPGVEKKVVSLKQITGKEFDPIQLSQELLSFLTLRFEMLSSGKGDELVTDYNNCLYKNGARVKLKKGPISFETTIRGVNALGQLITGEKGTDLHDWGSIEWIL